MQIMKSDEDVRMISAEAPVLFARVSPVTIIVTHLVEKCRPPLMCEMHHHQGLDWLWETGMSVSEGCLLVVQDGVQQRVRLLLLVSMVLRSRLFVRVRQWS